jgi:A/G-specific adenine glycosylase
MSISTDDFSCRFDPGRFDAPALARFRGIVLSWYGENRRSMPWRDTRDPWAILVSEIMLQQTQTERVRPKYLEWMERFPEPGALASAPLDEVLRMWSGLGYNRRALALARAAIQIVARHGGQVPRTESELLSLPGVGKYTAAALSAFAFGRASLLVETNVRAVFLHHFFPDSDRVPDRLLEPLVLASVDERDPRTWYYALMDYGVELKRRYGNPARRSAAHVTQTPFAGSMRRLRGDLLRILSSRSAVSVEDLERGLPFAGERVREALSDLVAEGFVAYDSEVASLARNFA